MIIFEKTEKVISEKEFIEFEESLGGLRFPNEFKEHYLSFNGGYPPEEYQYVIATECVHTINSFIPIKYGTLPIENLLKDFKKSGIMLYPKVPFAIDNGDNLFCISLDKRNYGNIFYLENQSLGKPNSFHFVSRSLGNFIKMFSTDIPKKKNSKTH